MKKILVIVGMVFTFIIASAFITIGKDNQFSNFDSGDGYYKVKVYYEVTRKYYDNGSVAFEKSSGTRSETFYVCESTADRARSEAKSECQSVCSRNSGRDMGIQTVNGVSYRVYEYRTITDTEVEYVREC